MESAQSSNPVFNHVESGYLHIYEGVDVLNKVIPQGEAVRDVYESVFSGDTEVAQQYLDTQTTANIPGLMGKVQETASLYTQILDSRDDDAESLCELVKKYMICSRLIDNAVEDYVYYTKHVDRMFRLPAHVEAYPQHMQAMQKRLRPHLAQLVQLKEQWIVQKKQIKSAGDRIVQSTVQLGEVAAKSVEIASVAKPLSGQQNPRKRKAVSFADNSGNALTMEKHFDKGNPSDTPDVRVADAVAAEAQAESLSKKKSRVAEPE